MSSLILTMKGQIKFATFIVPYFIAKCSVLSKLIEDLSKNVK